MVVAQTGNNLAIIFTSSTLVTVHNFHGFATEPVVVLTKSPSATIAALSLYIFQSNDFKKKTNLN